LALSFGLSGLGDALQQRYERATDGGPHAAKRGLGSDGIPAARSGDQDALDSGRCLRMAAAFGLTSGFFCHHWYNLLDKALPGASVRLVAKKILLDQLFSPVPIVSCLLVYGILGGATYGQLQRDVGQKGLRLYAADWLIWPPAQFVNFYYLPTRYRVFFDNAVSLVADVYCSRVNHLQD